MATIKESEAELANNFFASWDNISTNKAWNRPELYNLIKWRDTLLPLYDGLDGIDIFLVGGFAEYLYKPTNPLTWDMDVCFVIDESIDYGFLKSMMDDSRRISLDIGILLDQKAVTLNTYKFFQKLHSGIVPKYTKEDDMVYFINYAKMLKVRNGQIEIDTNLLVRPHAKITEVYPGFYKVVGITDRLIDKVVNKFNEGIYSGKVVNLKNSDFNFIM